MSARHAASRLRALATVAAALVVVIATPTIGLATTGGHARTSTSGKRHTANTHRVTRHAVHSKHHVVKTSTKHRAPKKAATAPRAHVPSPPLPIAVGDPAGAASEAMPSAPLSAAPVAAPVTTSPVAAPPAAVPATPTVAGISVLSFGAMGDGYTDDTAALQAAFDAATPGVPVVVPAGQVFAHGGVLHIRKPGTTVTGPGTLLATNESTSSVWIEADDVTLNGGLTLATALTTTRWSAWEQMGLRIDGHSGASLSDITVTGSAAAGIYIGGADHFTLDHVTVTNTRADGIHMTQGSYDGVITDPVTSNTGDDGIAVVSYAADGVPCHDITVSGAAILGTTGGRGMSVVGGTDITYSGFDIERSAAAGLYIGSEGAPWFTAAATDVTATNGTIVSANTDPTIDHGAVLVLSGETDAVPSGISISSLTIRNTRASASRDVGVISYGAPPSGVNFDGVTITGGPVMAYEGNTPQSSYSLRNWTQDGTPLPQAG